MFGLVFFQQQWLSILTFQAEGSGVVLGRSFIAAAAMMSLIALPLVVGATREALNAIPGHVREASYALGKTKAATIRRVLLPAARPGIGTGTALGMGRVAGDTAIVVVLLGASLHITNGGGGDVFGLFRGIGSTLTSYVYVNSPAGEGLVAGKGIFRRLRADGRRDRPQLRGRALGAAGGRRVDHLSRTAAQAEEGPSRMPPPVRRIVVDREPTVVLPPPSNGHGPATSGTGPFG